VTQKKYYGRSESNNRRSQAESNVKKISRELRLQRKKDDTNTQTITDLEKQLAEAESLVEKFKTEMGDMQVSSRTIVSHYALPAGLDLKGRIVILKANDRDLEMLEFGLNQLSRSPVLGAHSARGCGEITGVFDMVIDDKLTKKITIGGYLGSETDVL
jgi:hypothetical protein